MDIFNPVKLVLVIGNFCYKAYQNNIIIALILFTFLFCKYLFEQHELMFRSIIGINYVISLIEFMYMVFYHIFGVVKYAHYIVFSCLFGELCIGFSIETIKYNFMMVWILFVDIIVFVGILNGIVRIFDDCCGLIDDGEFE